MRGREREREGERGREREREGERGRERERERERSEHISLLQRVLTTEWIDGYRATDKESFIKEGLPFSEVARKVTLAFSEQLFCTGFVHGDPHPGNGENLNRIKCELVDM